MERLPLLIAVGSLLLWAAAALFMNRNLRTAARGLGLGLALVQLGCAAWGAARVLGDSGEGSVQYGAVWLPASPTVVFDLRFNLDAVGAVLWLALSVFAAILAYFALLRQIHGTRTQMRGEAVSVPLLVTGALCAITAANFLSYLFGWALVAPMAFLAVGFSAPNRDERAAASLRYLALNFLPEVIFVAGVLGCYASFGSLGFSELNAKSMEGTEWAVMCLVAGTMLRSLQIPLMQNARYLAAARAAGLPVLTLGHLVLAGTLFAKIHPAIVATEGMAYFGAVPALTALIAAALALAESDADMLVGWVASYVCASVFLSGLAGHYLAAQALAVTGSISVFLMATTLTELSEANQTAAWLIGAAALALNGVPLSGWGWARYLEYAGLFSNEQLIPSVRWLFLGLKVLADLMMGVALWGLVRERLFQREKDQRVPWETVVPLGLLTIASIAATTGGRPLSGLTGQFELEAYTGAAWFEKLVVPPAAPSKAAAAAVEAVASDADIFARLLLVGVFLVPALVAGFWFHRDRRALEEFRAGCQRLIQRVGRGADQDSWLWAWIIRPVSASLGRAAAFLDRQVIDRLLSDIWARPAGFVRDAFVFVEERIIDQRLIDGLADAFATVGKSMRLVQNGQVQFYFALGLILMGSVVIRFVLWGGGSK